MVRRRKYRDILHDDKNDAFFIANCLPFERPPYPFNASMDYLPLQRLTRLRKHIVFADDRL